MKQVVKLHVSDGHSLKYNTYNIHYYYYVKLGKGWNWLTRKGAQSLAVGEASKAMFLPTPGLKAMFLPTPGLTAVFWPTPGLTAVFWPTPSWPTPGLTVVFLPTPGLTVVFWPTPGLTVVPFGPTPGVTDSCVLTYIRLNSCVLTYSRLKNESSGLSAGGGGDSSVVRAQDSWLKGRGFESLLERRENFLLQGRLSVLTLISVSVPPPCYHSST